MPGGRRRGARRHQQHQQHEEYQKRDDVDDAHNSVQVTLTYTVDNQLYRLSNNYP